MFVCLFVLFVCVRSNCRNIGPIWMKFGMYLTNIDLRLPIENCCYSSKDLTMATEKLLKLGLIHSSFRNNGPIWMKFGAYLTGIDLKLPVENDRY